ncbi:hypothetical protein EPK97_09120 [Chengkuizengella sediminis]|nr:hypothetical protein [Chengkuizengella sediminis]
MKNQEKSLQDITKKLYYFHQEIDSLKENYIEHYFWAIKMSTKVKELLRRIDSLKNN